MRPITKLIFPEGVTTEQVVGYEVEGTSTRPIAWLDAFFEPPTRRQVAAWLAELSVITARREGSDDEERFRLEVYTRRCQTYPADVMRYALMERRWKFFPSWAELAQVCDDLVSPRQKMASVIRARAAE